MPLTHHHMIHLPDSVRIKEFVKNHTVELYEQPKFKKTQAFADELAEINMNFSEDMLVVCEEFQVVFLPIVYPLAGKKGAVVEVY